MAIDSVCSKCGWDVVEVRKDDEEPTYRCSGCGAVTTWNEIQADALQAVVDELVRGSSVIKRK